MKKFMFIMIAAIAAVCFSCHTEGNSSNKSTTDSISNDTTMVADSISVDSLTVAK